MLDTGLVRWAFGVNGAFICSPNSTPPPDDLVDYVLRSMRGSWLGRERVEPEGGGINNWIGGIQEGFKTRDLLTWGPDAGDLIYYRGLPILQPAEDSAYAFGENISGACLCDVDSGCTLIWMIGPNNKIYRADFDRSEGRLSNVAEALEIVVERLNAGGFPFPVKFDWEQLRFNAAGRIGYVIGQYNADKNPPSYEDLTEYLYGDTVVKISIADDGTITHTSDVEQVSQYEWTETTAQAGSASDDPEIDGAIEPGSGDYDFSETVERVTDSRVLLQIDFTLTGSERRAYLETTITTTVAKRAAGTWPRTKSEHLTVQSSGDATFNTTESVEAYLVIEGGSTTTRIQIDDKISTETGTGIPANMWQPDLEDYFRGNSAAPFGGTWVYQSTRTWSNIYALDIRFGVIVLAQEQTTTGRTYTFTDPEEYFADPDYLARADFSVTPRITTGSKNWRIEASAAQNLGSASIYEVRDAHETLKTVVFAGDRQYFNPPWVLFNYVDLAWNRVYAPTAGGTAKYPSGTIGAPEIDDYILTFVEINTGASSTERTGPSGAPIHDPAPEGWRQAEIDRYIVPDTGQVGVNESAIFVSLYFDADTGDDYINGIYDYKLSLQASAARLKTATNLPGDNQRYSRIRLLEIQ